MRGKRTNFKLEGFKELGRALNDLKKTTRRNIMKRAMSSALEPMRAEAAEGAPRDSGFLAAHVDTGTKLSRRAKSKGKKQSEHEMYMGTTARAGIRQEYGTKNFPPQPFMRPAWDNHKVDTINRLAVEVEDEIDKAVARAARKAERDARKMGRG